MTGTAAPQNWLVMAPNLSNKGVNGMVWSNRTLSQQVMIDEDIVPSIFAQLGCDVNPTIYSTGQNIFGQTRDWQVTTQNDSVILLNDNYVAKIKSNGLTEIQSKTTGNQLNQQLNTDMFNRAIKHISQFSQIK
jgi:membrane-anchored protein YejM (alkaline phosphatase superfamily)